MYKPDNLPIGGFFDTSRSIDGYIELIDTEGNVVDTITGYDSLQSMEIQRSVQTEEDFIGCALSKQYVINLLDKDKTCSFSGMYVKPYIGIRGDGETAYAPFPKAAVYESQYDTVKKTWSITCYDEMQKLNNLKLRDFNASAPQLTLRTYAEELCAFAGITLSSKPFHNENIVVKVNTWDAVVVPETEGPFCPNFSGEEFLREVIARIAQVALSNAVINRDGELELKSAAVEYNEEDNPKLTAEDYFSFSVDESFGPVNTVVLARGDTEDNVYYPAEADRDSVYMDAAETVTVADHIALYGVNELKIFDNPFFDRSTGDTAIDTRSQYTEDIFNVMRGRSYTAYTLDYRGNPALDEGDRFAAVTLDGETVETTYFSDTITFDGGLKCLSEGKIISQTATEYDKGETVSDVLRTTQIKVDKTAGSITSLTREVETNYYTKINTNELVQTAKDGLVNTFSSTGGNNIFKNTGLYFGNDNDYEDWFDADTDPAEPGQLVKELMDNSASGTCMMLQSGSVMQNMSLATGKYTVRFNYERVIPLSEATVSVNGNIELLGDSGVFEKTVDVTANALSVVFSCSTAGGYRIWELMGNAGEVASPYAQHENEMRTDTVSISKGIQVSSNSTRTITRIDADGLRVSNTNDSVVIQATETGMKADEIDAVTEANLVGFLIRKNGGEIWITGV